MQQHHAGAILLAAGGNSVALQRLQGAGQLPLAGFGQQVSAQLMDKAHTVLQAQATWLQQHPQALVAQPVDLVLNLGVTLTGTLTGLWGQSADAADLAAVVGSCLQLAARTGSVLQGQTKVQRLSLIHI